MKIVITSDLYYPMTNGVAVFAHNLARGLAKQGHEVMVFCPSFTGKKHKEKKEGVTTVYLSSVRFPFYPDQINKVPEKKEFLGLSMPRLVYRHGLWLTLDPYPVMKREMDRFRPDVIHNQTAEMIAVSARRYAKKRNVPMVSTGHAYPDNVTGQVKLLKPIKRPVDAILRTYMASFLKHSEYATMPTEMAIDDLVPKNRRRFKVPVEALSNGVDLSKFMPGSPNPRVLKKYHLKPNVKRVLYLGRVDPEKSISNVLLAFAEVLEKVPDAELVIAGDGIDKNHLMDLAKALGIDTQTKFLGRIMSVAEAVSIYQSATLFATASETETQGIVLIEAAATGLPIVAVDAGAVSELCQDGKNGELCRSGAIEELVAGMVKILTNEKLQKKYGAKSLVVARKHDLNRTLARFVEIYQEAIQLKKNRQES